MLVVFKGKKKGGLIQIITLLKSKWNMTIPLFDQFGFSWSQRALTDVGTHSARLHASLGTTLHPWLIRSSVKRKLKLNEAQKSKKHTLGTGMRSYRATTQSNRDKDWRCHTHCIRSCWKVHVRLKSPYIGAGSLEWSCCLNSWLYDDWHNSVFILLKLRCQDTKAN